MLWQDFLKMTTDRMATDAHHKDLHTLKAWAYEHWSLGIVLAISLMLRLGLYFFYASVSYSDTKTYHRLAGQILQGWINYDGSRTPGYPAFLAFLRTDQNAWLVQMGMGVLITLFMYFLGWQLGVNLERKRRQQLAFLAALVHTLNLGQLFFESSLLSETLSTFLFIVTVAGWVYGYCSPKARTIWLAGVMGIFSALAILTRGLFILLPFWTCLFILLFWVEKPSLSDSRYSVPFPERAYRGPLIRTIFSKMKSTYPSLVAYLVPFSLLIGLWVGFIRVHYNQWGLETIGGFRLVQNTGTFFEYVPDQYAAIRDTYIKYRDTRIDETGTQTNVIWRAIPEMMKVSGLGFYDLSRLVGKISLDLIRNHPGLYLQNVAKGWWLFWRAPVYWSSESLKIDVLVPVLNAVILVERLFIWVCNIFFLLTSLAVIWTPFRKTLHPSPLLGYLLGMIWSTSILQSFLDHGDNPRFLIPMQSLVVLWGLWFIFRFLPVGRNSPRIMSKKR